ncbi:MAG: hypothetical protein KatS3mg069_0312 [Meiothermus sp.]|nr:MAG: hypothetical protein KatS3mg069_0312 [Meiothermus sp.]
MAQAAQTASQPIAAQPTLQALVLPAGVEPADEELVEVEERWVWAAAEVWRYCSE